MGKASRLLWEARRRAALSQTEVARIAGVPLRTLTRIEAGEAVPRLDTLDRLLLSCGRTLTARPRAPALETSGEVVIAPHIFVALRFLAGAFVSHCVVGDLAARLHGGQVSVPLIEIVIPESSTQRGRLLRALSRIDRPLSRVPVSCHELEPARFHEISRVSNLMGPIPTPVACLDDLIEVAEDDERRHLLEALREERDRVD